MENIRKCLNVCNIHETFEDCVKQCSNKNNQEECIHWCIHKPDLCKESCIENTELYNKYLQCSKGYCKNSDFSCLNNSKNSIIHCCKENCIPTKEIDCDKYCNFLYDTLLTKQITIHNKTSKQNNNSWKLLTVVLLLFVFIKLIFSL